MAKKALSTTKSASKSRKEAGEPKRLSKAGEWMRANPDGVIIVHDLKAILK